MAAAPRPEAARLSLRVKLGYGGAEGAGSLLWTVYYTFFLFFLTDVVKMRAGAAGFIRTLPAPCSPTISWGIVDPVIGTDTM